MVVAVCAFEKHRKDARRKRNNMAVGGKSSLCSAILFTQVMTTSVYFYQISPVHGGDIYILRLRRFKNLKTVAVDLEGGSTMYDST